MTPVVSDSNDGQWESHGMTPSKSAEPSVQSKLGPILMKAGRSLLNEALVNTLEPEESKRIEDVCRLCQESKDATSAAHVDGAYAVVLLALDLCVRYVGNRFAPTRNVAFEDAMAVARVLQEESPGTDTRLDNLYRSLEGLGKSMAQHRELTGAVDVDLAIQYIKTALEVTVKGSLAETLALLAASRLYEARYQRARQPEGYDPQSDLKGALSTMQKAVARGTQHIADDAWELLRMEADCIRLQLGEISEGLEELDVPAEHLTTKPLSLGSLRPCRFRFIHCQSFIQDSTIRILGFDRLPEERYSAISYVWKGLETDDISSKEGRFMVVKGSEEADPISLAVLRSACLASLNEKCEMIWLDRLGMIQASSVDKAWQIKHMFRIYQSCCCCFILPGGLTRLASIDEQTSWMDRAWTLQEAVAPAKAVVIFSWPWGTTTSLSMPQPPISELEPGRSGVSGLEALLRSGGLTMSMGTTYTGDRPQLVNKIFGGERYDYASVALMSSMGRPGPERSMAIWRSSFLRTSSRPVDMIFSIMGLLGVTLEPSAFQVGDRRQALVELARTLLSKGEGAHWLGLFLDIDTDTTISWLPAVPKTSVSGKAYIDTHRGLEAMKDLVRMNLPWYLDRSPGGEMDEEGYFTFEAKAAPVRRLPGQNDDPGRSAKKNAIVQYPSGQLWDVREETSYRDIQHGEAEQYYCLVISGRKPLSLAYLPLWVSLDSIVMLVQRTAQDKWRCLGYGLIYDALTISGHWAMRKFTVGGPV